MEIKTLWEKLSLPTDRMTTFKKDIAEGKVPELPFYIVGQDKLKATIKQRVEQIDQSRMITNLIIAEYGNGKTNLLKYLELFFKTHNDLGISVQYSRADVERTDLVIFLLKIIQDKYLHELIRIVKILRETPDVIPTLANNFDSNFREIEEYVKKLFEKDLDDPAITEILYLGTGRLSNKRYFDKLHIEQLRDFNRREILVLFLNILSQDNKYIIFAIDEIEKIREKSKIRFSHFLTSYRELVDLFNQIKGHYLIVSFTDSIGSSEISNANNALYTRIKGDIAHIEPLKSKADIQNLIIYLNDLFDTKKDINDIYTGLSKRETTNNRSAIQEISKLLYAQESVESLAKMLADIELADLFTATSTKLDNDEAFKNMHRKFFDPLEYYIESLGQNSDGLNKQDRTFIDVDAEKVHYFIFNTYLEDFENEKIKIKFLIDDNPGYSIIVYAPITLELTHSKLDMDQDNLSIIDIEPKDLFVLLVMYRDNFDLQPQIAELISNYSRQKL
jgi:hypothetical protein